MKTTIALGISILFFCQFIYAAPSKDQTDIEQAITEYVKSVDNRNVDQLSKSVLPLTSIVIVNEMTNTVENYTSAQFVSLVKNGQKGGWQRNIAFGPVTIDGNIAVAKIDITDLKIKELCFVTLIKDNGAWKIADHVSTLQLNK